MVTSIIGIVLALLKAVPIFDQWFQAMYSAYFQMKSDAHDKEFVDAQRQLISNHDQRALEAAAGSSSANKPSADQSEIITRPINHG
jgi:hypothetical protein